jgi:hypothetical protein
MKRSLVPIVAACCALAALIGGGGAAAQDRAGLAGVWKLVSATNTTPEGKAQMGSFGPTPNGQLILTESGQFSSVNTHSDLPRYENRMKGSPEQYKGVVHGSTASFGTWTVSPDRKTITMRQEGGTFAIRNGTEEAREFRLNGDELRWKTKATYGGVSELVYQRVR